MMLSSYSLLSRDGKPDFYLVEIEGNVIGEVAFMEGGRRYRLEDIDSWSATEFGSECEASEFVLVDRNLLQVNENGVIVSWIKIPP